MAYSECLPTHLNPLAERTCFFQVPGEHQAKFHIHGSNVFAVVLEDGPDGTIQMRILLKSVHGVHFRYNPNIAAGTERWQPVSREPPATPCQLLPAEVRDKVHLELRFAQTDRDALQTMHTAMLSFWPDLDDEADRVLTCVTQMDPSNDSAEAEWSGGAARKCIDAATFAPEACAELVEVHARRLRSAYTHLCGSSGTVLALSKCRGPRERLQYRDQLPIENLYEANRMQNSGVAQASACA